MSEITSSKQVRPSHGPSLSELVPMTLDQRLNLAPLGGQIAEEQRVRLLQLEKEVAKLELLGFLSEQVHREQEIFWLRFGAFAAVHAGALVLVTSDVVTHKPVVGWTGLVLAAAWLYVQWISLKYADRPKSLYHWYRRSLGILWPYEYDPKKAPPTSIWRRANDRVQRMMSLSSTNIGILIPLGVAVLWVLALVR